MDLQSFQWLAGQLVVIGGIIITGFYKTKSDYTRICTDLWTHLNNAKKDLSDYKLHVAETYANKVELKEIKDVCLRIEQKLDQKQDKK